MVAKQQPLLFGVSNLALLLSLFLFYFDSQLSVRCGQLESTFGASELQLELDGVEGFGKKCPTDTPAGMTAKPRVYHKG